MTKVYKVTLDEKKFNLLQDNGWIAVPPIMGKMFEIEYGGEATDTLVHMFNDKVYQSTLLSNEDIKKYLRKRGIRFRKGNLVINEKFKELATKWQITIDANEDGWVGISSIEEYYPYSFHNKDILDKYCEKEINELKSLGVLEEIEVED